MTLDHEYIVQYVHQTWQEDAEPRPSCSLYMELCGHGDLYRYIEDELRNGCASFAAASLLY